jgi:hypothetical protein
VKDPTGHDVPAHFNPSFVRQNFVSPIKNTAGRRKELCPSVPVTPVIGEGPQR